jgi:hypothetical protein
MISFCNKARLKRLCLKYHLFIVILIYLLITFIIAFPVIINPSGLIYGKIYEELNKPSIIYADPLGVVWDFWWLKYSFINKIPNNFYPYIGYPNGLQIASLPDPVWKFISTFLSLITNEIVAYNILVLISFPLSGITMYLLAFYLLKDRFSSFISGLIYMLSPYHMVKSLQHLGLAHIQFIPFLLLSLFIFRERRNWLSSILVGISYAIVFSFSYYYGYFALFLVVLFFIFDLCYILIKKEKKSLLKILSFYIISGITSILLISPTIISILKFRAAGISQGVFKRSLENLYVYSTRGWEYLVPSIDNPILGKFFKSFITSNLHGSNIAEITVYLGYIPLLLSFFGLFFWFKTKNSDNLQANIQTITVNNNKKDYKSKFINERLSFAIPFLSISAIVWIILSLPPSIGIGSFTILMPTYFLHKIFPMFRVYSRMAVLVILSTSLLAGLGLRFIIEKIKKIKIRYIIIVLIMVLIFIEFINIPPYKTINAEKIPPVYSWLKEQPKDLIIAEYPMVEIDYGLFYTYKYYQRIHFKKIINGSEKDKIMSDLEDPYSTWLLNKIGVDYIIIHENRYKKELLPILGNLKTLELVKNFGDDKIYKITNELIPLSVHLKEGFYGVEIWSNAKWQWLGQKKGTLEIINFSPGNLNVNLSFYYKVFPDNFNRNLSLYLNNNKIIEKASLTGLNKLSNININLKPGFNKLSILAGEPLKIDDFLHNGDIRKVSVAISRIEFKIKN